MDEINTPILSVKNVSKTFGGVVHALDDVGLNVFRNEIVGVVGENGAGKTTLMKTLVGIHVPDEGVWEYNGENVSFPASPKEAAQKGISIVYQEKGVIPSLKVYQFLFLGNEEKYSGRTGLQIGRMKANAAEIIKEFNINCKIDDYLYELPLSVQKMIEIAKAVLSVRLEQDDPSRGSVIIMDEPTSPLTIEERKVLLKDITAMKTNTSFIFVTHIMQEIRECVDRLIVLRDGKRVGHYDMTKEKLTEEELAKAIVGKDVIEHRNKARMKKSSGCEKVILEAENLTKKGEFYNISFDIKRGECIGIFGPAGSGKSEIIKAIAGLNYFEEGSLKVMDRTIPCKEAAHIRLSRGIGYCSGDMSNELFYDWSISKNISILNILDVVSKIIPIINFGREQEMAERIFKKLRIKANNVNTIVETLSGGNKQKVTVGKWFEQNSALLLLEDPTVGIDVGAREDIYDTVLELKNCGTGMILVSDDVSEYTMLCDKILMLKEGEVQRLIPAEELEEVLEI